ncbi:hypothetical protein, partial [Streptomyces albidochromogenes]
TVQRWRGLEDIPQDWGRSVVTIGSYDGVHRVPRVPGPKHAGDGESTDTPAEGPADVCHPRHGYPRR